MAGWINVVNKGTGSTVRVNPMILKRDIDEKVRTLEPEATPLLTLLGNVWKGMGKPPESKKIETLQHYAFDHIEEVSYVLLGTGSYKEFVLVKIPQKTRPKSGSTMFYSPQDMFTLPTGQQAMVWCTPDACYKVNGAEYALDTTTTGSASTTRTNPGYLVLRNVQPSPIISFTAGSYMRYVGYSIWEGQPFAATSKEETFIFRSNYVETMEAVLEMTNDQIRYAKTYGWINNLSKQQELTLKRFRKEVEYKHWFGVKSLRLDQDNRPFHTMDGIIPQIRTNVTMYNPFDTVDFENFLSLTMNEQGFRWGPNVKTGHCGMRFLHNFNVAFKEFRRSDLSEKNPKPGLNIDTYHWMGNTLKLVRNEVFRQGTPQENWCCIIDPNESEPRVAIDFESKDIAGPRDRVKQMGWTWQGSIAMNREEHSSIIRTYAA